MEQTTTHNNRRKRNPKLKVLAMQTRIEPELVALLDEECLAKGRCSRALLIRQMLIERYNFTVTQPGRVRDGDE